MVCIYSKNWAFITTQIALSECHGLLRAGVRAKDSADCDGIFVIMGDNFQHLQACHSTYTLSMRNDLQTGVYRVLKHI